ncbi:MAG: diaminopimelate decarboxylase [Clostridia bacterium]|nr:diaminopimelate decarboxylase [Clostridia bacterium]
MKTDVKDCGSEKKLFFNRETAEKIASAVGTPYYLYDEKGIKNALAGLREAFRGLDFKEYFAVKACPNPYILKVLKDAGAGVDCSSYTELLMAKACGFRGADIMFSSNVTPAEDFELARSLDALINLDDITHIEFLEQHGGIPETVCMRYNPGGDFTISGAIMGAPGEAKYGMTREQILESCRILKGKGVKTFGLHSFLASNMLGNRYWETLSEVLLRLAADIKRETGITISFINLSGGIGIPYKPTDKPVDIFKVGETVEKKIGKICAEEDLPVPAVKAELGRYITGPYGVLVARCIHKKDIYREYVGLDACAANLMRPAMYGSYHHITVLGKENEPKTKVYDVTGGLCENNDKFAIERSLPEIEIGDLIAIHDAGAHGFSMGYNYNGKLRSAEVLLKEDGTFKLIRRAETPEDYFATFDFPGAEIKL